MNNKNKLIAKINNLLGNGVLSKFDIDNVGAIRQRLVSFLGLKKKGRFNSAYPQDGYLITSSGDTLTLRIADHPAAEKNFRAKYNVSIIVSDKVTVTETIGSTVYCEYVYDSSCFSDDNKEETLREIFTGILEALKTGKYLPGRIGKCKVHEITTDSFGENDDDEQDDETLGSIDREELKKSIIDAVTSNLLDWHKPWKPYANGFSKVNGKVATGCINAYSLRRYNSENSIRLLDWLKLFNGCNKTSYAPIFVSKKMIERQDWKLKISAFKDKKGESRTPWVVVQEKYIRAVQDPEELERATTPTLHCPYFVINGVVCKHAKRLSTVTLAENIEGNPFSVERAPVHHREMTQYIENVINAYSHNVAPVFHDQYDRCFYHPSTDEIHLVPADAFDGINGYYSTRFHETTHSTLHPSRLNRSFPYQDGFGSEGYAMEELVAEMGAWIMCSELGISFCPKDKTPAKDNSTAYIGDWLIDAKKLYDNDDEKTLLAAYEYANKAVDCILKDVNLDDMIPESVKQQEDETLSDVILFNDDSVCVVNARRDSRIRFFFTVPPSEDVRSQLKEAGLHYSGIFKAWQIANTDEGLSVANKIISEILGKTQPAEPSAPDTDGKKLRLIKLKSKSAKAKLELLNLGDSQSLGGLTRTPSINSIKNKIRKALTNPRYNEDINCHNVITDQTTQVIRRYDKNLKIQKWFLPAHALRHIKNTHPELFERSDAIDSLLSVISNPSCVNQGLSVIGKSLALQKYFGSMRIVVIFLVEGDYNDIFKLKTGYLKGLGVHDAESRPAGYVRNVLSNATIVKLDNIIIE